MTGHTHKRLFAIGITIALLAGTSWGEERTWTDVTGKFSVTAELVEVRGDKVVLRRQNGKQITVPLAKLNAEDQQFLKLAELKAQAQAELEKGELFLEKQDWDTALVCFTEAIRLNPNFADAYYNRGVAYYYKGGTDKAIADWTETIRLDPNYAAAYYSSTPALEESKLSPESRVANMLKIDRDNQSLSLLDTPTLADVSITVRYDLQEFIANSLRRVNSELETRNMGYTSLVSPQNLSS